MRKNVLLILVIFILLTSCASPVRSNSTSDASSLPTKVESTSAHPATLPPASDTPTPEPTPSPTPVTVPLDFNAKNFSQFTGVQNYSSVLTKYFKREVSDLGLNATDFSLDGSLIAVSGCITSCKADLGGGSVFLVILDTKQQAPVIELSIDDQTSIYDLDFTPDARSVIYTVRGKVMSHELTTDNVKVIWSSPNENLLPVTDISADGKFLAIETTQQIFILDLASGKQITSFSGDFKGQSPLFFDADSTRLVVSSKSNQFEFTLYETSTWQEVFKLSLESPGKPAISSNGSQLAILPTKDPQLRLYDLASGDEKSITIQPYNEANSAIFSPKGDLLLVFGSPGQEVDFFEGVQVIDVKTGKVVGSLTQYSNPGRILFSADGTSFLRPSFSTSDFELWALPTSEIIKAGSLVQDYFEAVSSGDYEKAAAMTRLSSYDADELKNSGLDVNDLPAAFARLCVEDEIPCLPLSRIVRIMADTGEDWDYYAIVTLKNQDGTEVMFDGLSPYELLGISVDPQGALNIASLHPGMRYPYPK